MPIELPGIDFNKDVTLFLAIDGRITDTENLYRNYENELWLCLNAWRRIYKNTPIILFQPHDFSISDEIVDKIMSITKPPIIIKDPSLYHNKITCGFDLKALSGYILLNEYNYLINTKYVLNIDLDMYLINELYIPELMGDLIIGRYTNKPELDLTNKLNPGIMYKNDKRPFDTGFILLNNGSDSRDFFDVWYHDIEKLRKYIQDNPDTFIDDSQEDFIQEYILDKKDLDYELRIDSIEEWLVSYYYFKNFYNIGNFVDYQYGEFYPEEFTENPPFFHHHYYPNARPEAKQKYWKKSLEEYILDKQIQNKAKKLHKKD